MSRICILSIKSRMRAWRRGLCAFVGVVLCLLLLPGCSTGEPQLQETAGPEEAIDALLTLRYERSQDASLYAEYVSEPDVAVQLATSAADATSSPVPAWDDPYVSEEGTSSADVVVVWEDPGGFASDWPMATVFHMVLQDDRWVAVDATPAYEESDFPAPGM